MMDRTPTVSVYTACRNGARYLRATLDSILAQTLADFEIVIADGASTDGTLEILRDYSRDPRVRWVSEPDENAIDGFYKALERTRGRYIMCLPVSDCYVSTTWFEACAALLESDPDVSMVHGNVRRMTADSTLLGPMHPDWVESPPPGREAYFAYWLGTFQHAAEITYCVRSRVYRQCYPAYVPAGTTYADAADPLDDEQFDRFSPHLRFLHRFHAAGYLAAYLPVLATAARENLDNLTVAHKRYSLLEAKKYVADIKALRDRVLAAPQTHRFRNGHGDVIAGADVGGPGGLAALVQAYRVNGRLMWDWVDDINIHHQQRARLFRAKWSEWADALGRAARVAIYGGGMHTDQLLEVLGPAAERLNVVAIVDQRPCGGESMRGIPLAEKAEFDFSGIEQVMISSKCYEQEIFDDLSRILPPERIKRIYGT